MAEGTTPEIVDIQKQVENLKKTLGDLKHILDQLNTARSVVCKIVNNTDITLALTFQHHDHGGFATIPPIVIEPRSAGAFGSQSSSGALFTGTSGTVHYVGGGMLLQCDWNNPWAGSNSCEITWKRDDATGKYDVTGRYRTWNIAGSGDQHAEMLFAVSLVPEQYAWRSCRNCNVLFFDGSSNKGACAKPPSFGSTLFDVYKSNKLYTEVPYPYAASEFRPEVVHLPTVLPPSPLKRQHEAAGFVYILSHSYPPQWYQQAGWRFCHKCSALFFDGYADKKGVCPNGGGHDAAGFQFMLTNEVPWEASPGSPLPGFGSGTVTNNSAPPWWPEPPWGPGQQPGWRFCHKCFALFFDGWPENKGVCPNGGGHEAEGLHFILNHHT